MGVARIEISLENSAFNATDFGLVNSDEISGTTRMKCCVNSAALFSLTPMKSLSSIIIALIRFVKYSSLHCVLQLEVNFNFPNFVLNSFPRLGYSRGIVPETRA